MNQSFSKIYRLLSKSDFLSLREDSHFLYQNTILVFYKKNLLNNSRLGVSVSKKVGKSHIRNYFKRTIREFFRKSHFKNQSFDILIVINPKMSKLILDDIFFFKKKLEKDLNQSFTNIHNQ